MAVFTGDGYRPETLGFSKKICPRDLRGSSTAITGTQLIATNDFFLTQTFQFATSNFREADRFSGSASIPSVTVQATSNFREADRVQATGTTIQSASSNFRDSDVLGTDRAVQITGFSGADWNQATLTGSQGSELQVLGTGLENITGFYANGQPIQADGLGTSSPTIFLPATPGPYVITAVAVTIGAQATLIKPIASNFREADRFQSVAATQGFQAVSSNFREADRFQGSATLIVQASSNFREADRTTGTATRIVQATSSFRENDRFASVAATQGFQSVTSDFREADRLQGSATLILPAVTNLREADRFQGSATRIVQATSNFREADRFFGSAATQGFQSVSSSFREADRFTGTASTVAPVVQATSNFREADRFQGVATALLPAISAFREADRFAGMAATQGFQFVTSNFREADRFSGSATKIAGTFVVVGYDKTTVAVGDVVVVDYTGPLPSPLSLSIAFAGFNVITPTIIDATRFSFVVPPQAPGAFKSYRWSGDGGATSTSPVSGATLTVIALVAATSNFREADRFFGTAATQGFQSVTSNFREADRFSGVASVASPTVQGVSAFREADRFSGTAALIPAPVSAISTFREADRFQGIAGTIPPAPTITAAAYTVASGGSFILAGNNFTNVTSVSFGGASVLAYVVLSATQILVTMTFGGLETGPITVVTTGGTATGATVTRLAQVVATTQIGGGGGRPKKRTKPKPVFVPRYYPELLDLKPVVVKPKEVAIERDDGTMRDIAEILELLDLLDASEV